ncbi:WbqC family protein [Candidatus Pelagibacter sp.]|nr:WbqC family protein [Candidatus Pelagibacter sp.]
MFLSAHQPTYLPWLGLFHKIHTSDLFVVYDDVEYSRHGWYNRNYILSKSGPLFLVVPVLKDSHQQLHNQVKIDNSKNWSKKHIKSIELCYSKAPYFNDYMDLFISVLNKKYDFLIDLNISILKLFLQEFDIKTEIKFASEFNLLYKKSDRVLDLAIKTKANHYLFGELGSDYAEIDRFKKKSIKVIFQKYNHPIYNQFNSKKFISKLSSIDLLFNYGKKSKKILLSDNLTKSEYINS